MTQQFLDFLQQQQHYSVHTVKSYDLDLQALAVFMEACNLAPHSMTKKECRKFVSQRFDQQLSAKSIARSISTFRHFWSFLQIRQYVSLNPWKQLRLPKVSRVLPAIISPKKMIAFLDSFDCSSKLGLRNRCICECLYGMGLRVSELCDLKMGDLSLELGECRVLGKGNKVRIAVFGEITKQILQQYFDHVRSGLAVNKVEYVFLNSSGKPLTVRTVQRVVKSASIKQGISPPLTPHVLRHCYASDLYKGGADISVIKELLGHDHLATTEIYTHVANEELQQTMWQSHPRN